MSYGVKEVSNSRRCPICGKPEWCGFLKSPDGEMIICKRATGTQKKQGVMGTDGHFYMCVGISRGDNPCFMEAGVLKSAMDSNGGKEFVPRMPEPPKEVDPIEQLPDDMLDKFYRAMMSHLKLEDVHREYLHKEGWTDEMIKKYNIVSFPEKDRTRFNYRKNVRLKNPYRKRLAKQMLEDLGNPKDGLQGLPGAFLHGEDWTFTGPSGIIFWQYNAIHQVVGVRIRMDYMDVNGELQKDSEGTYFLQGDVKWYLIPMKGAYQILPDGTRSFRKDGMFRGKYRNFSSYLADEKEESENNRLVNIYNKGCAAGNKLSFYSDCSRDDMYIAYITEGEKKGAFANYKMRAPFIALPGVDSWTLLFKGKNGERPVDILKNNGCKIIVVAFDADKSTNETVLDRERKTAEALRQEGFILGVASWDIHLGKGIDDLLAGGHKPSYEVY